MMKLTRLFAVVISLFLITAAVFASEAKVTAKKEEPAKKELKSQTHCPVMGGKIDSTIFTDIQGQRVYHCCPMCSGKLKADPDKYFKKAAEQAVLFENIQTVCPVSGEELEEKTVFTDFEGRRVYFCCKKCRGTFAKEPAKYLAKLDAKPTKETKKESHGKTSHEGHNH